jgi:uncharacterized RDD family membrane protein YckC
MSAESAQPTGPAGRLVTADTLAVAPAVLGQPLAEPWRRAAAMGLDLAAVGLLSLLSAPWLGLATGALLIVLFGNASSAPLALKAVRGVCRLLGAGLALLSVLILGHVSLVREGGLHVDALTGRPASAAMNDSVDVTPEASASDLRTATAKLQKQVEDLKAENRDLQAASTSWTYRARSFANALGVTFGWSGVYFTLLAGGFGGRTLGKLLLRTRAVKTNGLPFTFFDAFVRNGGYVAGVAMGMMGFLKLLWEPNRQTVEDRIAGTVVVKIG